MKLIRQIALFGAVFALLASATRAEDKPTTPKDADAKSTEFNGVLRTGVVAIGGETTGTTLSADGKTYELDFRKSSELRALANSLKGKKVVVRGTLQRKRGVEIKERWIITVTALRAARAEKSAPPSDKGKSEKFESPDPAANATAKRDEVVHKLTVKVDPIAASQWSAKPGITMASDEKELTSVLGEATAKQIKGKLDFEKEKLVHVAWGSGGPPFGELKYEIKEEKDGKAITFYVKEPKVSMRGQAFRLGNDFFAVPRAAKVKFGETR